MSTPSTESGRVSGPWLGKDNKKTRRRLRAARWRRLWIGEQLEQRTAPGSMLTEVAALAGCPLPLDQLNGRTDETPPPHLNNRDDSGAPTQSRRAVKTQPHHPKSRLWLPSSLAVQQDRELAGNSRHESSYQRRDQSPGEHIQRNRSSEDPTAASNQVLVGLGLENGLEEPIASGERHLGRSGSRRAAARQNFSSPSGQVPTPELGARGGQSLGIQSADKDSPLHYSMNRGGEFESGMAAHPPRVMGSPGYASTLAAESSPTSYAIDTQTAVNPVTAGNVALTNSTSPIPFRTTQLGFDQGLTGWNIHEVGGTPEGKGTVTVGSAILREGDSFLVTLDQEVNIPEDPEKLTFLYEASFDTTDRDSINDAFEAALIDADGETLVYAFSSDRDAYFNLTEEMPSALGRGTTEETVDDRNHVSLDISHLEAAADATLVFRLVNNDMDENTTVRILDVALTSGNERPSVTVGLVNDTAPDSPDNEPYLSDLLTNDPRVQGTAHDDEAVQQLEIQVDDGPFVDITPALVDGQYAYDPGVLESGTHRVTVRGTDALSQTSASSLEFTMNAPPTPDAGGDQQDGEAASVTFDAAGSFDLVGEIHSYSWRFHDGTTVDGVTATKTYSQDGQAQTQLLGTGTGEPDQLLHTVAPLSLEETLAISVEADDGWGPWQEVDSLDASGPDDTHFLFDRSAGTVRFGNGIHGARPDVGRRISATYPAPLDVQFPVTLTVTDTAGSVVTQDVVIVIDNLATNLNELDDLHAVEGDPVSLQAIFTDPGFLDTHTARIDWGDGSTTSAPLTELFGQGTVSAIHTYADNGQYGIVVEITDDGNAVSNVELEALVTNAAPTAQIEGPDTGYVNSSITFAIDALDPGSDDMQADFTYAIDWNGDSVFDQTVVGPASGLRLEHTYTQAGNYAITVTATDKDGDTGPAAEHILTVPEDAGTVMIGGYVYLDVNDDGIHETCELALPNVPITVTGNDLTRTVLTNENGWYEFRDLPSGEYQVHELQPTAFIDGQETIGEPAMGNVGDDMFYDMQLPPRTVARYYNFGERGLRPELISKRFYLASTPTGQELRSMIEADTGEGWFAFSTDTEGELVVDLQATVDGSIIELYTNEMMPLALSQGERSLTASVSEGEGYVLHIAGNTNGDPLQASLDIQARSPSDDPLASCDVNGDGWISALDALLVIHQLNKVQSPVFEAGDQRELFDVNRDGILSPFDALLVIRCLNMDGAAVGENPADDAGESTHTRFFVVDEIANATFRYADDGTSNGRFTMDETSVPRGATSNVAGDRVWVVDAARRHVDVYGPDGRLKDDWEATGTQQPEGIATDGSNIWIVDTALNSVLQYPGAAAFTGNLVASMSFDLNPVNVSPTGIATDGSLLWVSDDVVDAVFVYSTAGDFIGSWLLDSANSDAAGITNDPSGGTDLWIVDRSDALVYRYAGAARRYPNAHLVETFALADGNRNPEGIADPPQSPAGDSLLDQHGQAIFTTTDDFLQGELFNVNAADVPDELRLSRELSTYHHIWMSNTNEGTISKVDTRTGHELARYRTGPDSWGGELSPSRTAVTSEGDAWVANRSFHRQGSVVKIFNTSFVDRNGNGICDTSQDLDGNGLISPSEMMTWDANLDGQPDDERIALVIQAGRDRDNPDVLVPNGVPRALVIDANDDVWVGAYEFFQYEVYDGRTGELEAIVPTEYNPYGATIDQHGTLWSTANPNRKLERVDTTTRTYVGSIDAGDTYGITVDEDGVVWFTTFKHSHLFRYDPATGELDSYMVAAIWAATQDPRGVAVDRDRNVWVAATYGDCLFKYIFDDDHRTLLDTQIIFIGDEPTAAVIDSDGYVWSTTRKDNLAWKIDPSTNTVVEGWPIQTGEYPYNYSDMTGVTRLTVTEPTGHWTETFDAGRQASQWGTVVLEETTPGGTAVDLRVRASDTRTLLDALPWTTVDSGTVLHDFAGQYLQTRIVLRSDDHNVTPSVHAVSVAAVLAPEVQVELPADGSQFDAGTSVIVTGQGIAKPFHFDSEHSHTNVINQVTVNGTMVDVLDASGNFFSQVGILPGLNVFDIVATDTFGQTASTTLALKGIQRPSGEVDLERLVDLTASVHGQYSRTSFNELTNVLHTELAVRNEGRYEADAPLRVGITHVSDPSVAVIEFEGRTSDGIPYYDFTAQVSDKVLDPGEVTFTKIASFYNPQRIPFTYDLVILGQLNEPPAMITQPVVQALAGRPYQYDAKASDSDDDRLSFALLAHPVGMNVDPSGGQITWNPTIDDVGAHSIVLAVDDGRGGRVQQKYAVTVEEAPPNRPPVFQSVPIVAAYVNEAYEYSAQATDADGDSIIYSIATGPAGMEIDPDTGQITWQPHGQQTEPQVITVAATDGLTTAEQTFTIVVGPEPQNHSPIFITDPAMRVLEGETYQYQARAIDPDEDTIAYSLEHAPAGMTIDPATGLVTWAATARSPSALVFDNQDFVATDLYIDQSGSTGVTMEAWVYPTELGIQYVVTTDSGWRNWGILQFYGTWTIGCGRWNSSTNVPVDMNAWQHIAAVFEPGVGVYFYKNGVETFLPDIGFNTLADPVTIGRSLSVGGSFQGAIDEVRVWNEPRESGEIQETMHRLVDGEEPGLLGYWRFDESAGTIAQDLTGHGYDGTLTSANDGELPDWSLPGAPTLPFRDVSILSDDGRGGSDAQQFELEVAAADAPNADPAFVSTPPVEAGVGHTYVYLADAVDPDGDVLQYGLDQSPQGMEINALDGRVRWIPTAGQIDIHHVVMQVTDARGTPVQQSFDVQVVAVTENGAPEILSTPPSAGVVGQWVRYDVLASDPDANPLSFDLPVHPDGMAFDAETGSIRWLPGIDQSGYHDVILRVRDGRGGVDLQSFVVEVASINRAPQIRSVPPDRARLGQSYNYLVRASDADADSLTYRLLDGPAGMTVDAATGLLSWQAEDTPRSALQFEGNGAVYTALQLDPALWENGVTVEAWVYPTDGGWVFSTDNGGYDLSVSTGAKDHWHVGAGIGFLDTEMPIDFDQWQHIAVVVVPDVAVFFYKNGEEASLLDFDYGDSSVMSIGYNNVYLRYFHGNMDEFRVWHAPRTQEQIQSEMYRTLTGDEPGLVGYWRFDEGSGSVAYDLSPSGYDGALKNRHGADDPSWTMETAPVVERYRNVTIQVEDGRGGLDTQTFTLEVGDYPNDPPVIVSRPPTTTLVDSSYEYQIHASDPNGDSLAYSFDNVPIGMTVDVNGLVQWDPTITDLGSHLVTIRVEDGHGGFITQTYTLDVVAELVNSPPQIISLPRISAVVDEPYVYTALAYDRDDDPLGWDLEQAPDGLTFYDQDARLEWTPRVDQLGDHDVTLRVVDIHGAAHAQSFTITVRAENTPPIITSTPVTAVDENGIYRCPFVAYDPDWGPLIYNVTTAPDGMRIDPNTGLVQWEPGPGQEGSHQVVVQVEDDQGSVATQQYDVEVASQTPNQTPEITSTPPFEAKLGLDYEYRVIATDADAEPLRFELHEGPVGMQIDAVTGLVQWSPLAADLGDHDITVAALDAIGAGALQSYVLTVRQANQPPQIHSQPVATVTGGVAYHYDLWASDPDGDPLQYVIDDGPTGMTADEFGRVVWPTSTADVGVHDIAIIVDDGWGGMERQEFQLEVLGDSEPPSVQLILDRPQVDVGESLTVTVLAVDNVDVETVTLAVDGVTVELDGAGRANVTLSDVGTVDLVATATDSAGNRGEASDNVLVVDPSVTGDPIVELMTPSDFTTITAPVDVIGTASDDELLYYTLSVAPVSGGPFHEIVRSDRSISNDVLGKLDPSLLVNDSYLLRLHAVDTGGNDATTQVLVHVDGELKLGNFRLSFTDIEVPVTGIPITFIRTYDTLQADQSSDVGYGWQLEYRDVRLRTSVAETGLEEYDIYAPFREGTRVYITLPGGKRESFVFRPINVGLQLGNVRVNSYLPRFESADGSYSTLSVSDVELVRRGNEYFAAGGTGIPYNPASSFFESLYTLTTWDGVEYDIDAQSGQLLTTTDRNDNTLHFTHDGIISSTGSGITFERDPRGRIVAVMDPIGNQFQYAYDSRGNLTTVIDRENNVTRFEYTLPTRTHYLTQIIEPLGRTGARTQYDDSGRLIGMTDGAGELIELIHDPDNFVETVVDQLGNTTVYEYDTWGNILTEIDPEGGVTRRSYSDADNPTLVTSFINPLGHETSFTYDGEGNTLAETDPFGNETRYTYGNFRTMMSVTDSMGNTVLYTVSRKGNISSRSDAAGNTMPFGYGAGGQLITMTDPLGNVTSYEYDAAGNVTRETNVMGFVTTYTYDDNGNRLTETTTQTTSTGARALTSSRTYDGQNRELSYTDAEGHTSYKEYDALGNKVAAVDALGRRTEFVYDERSQLIETRFPDETIETSAYDAAGRRTAWTDRAGRSTYYRYDKNGQLIETVYPDATPGDLSDNPRTSAEYDAAGNQIAKIDENHNRTEFVFDAANRKIKVRDALGQETTLSYDANGRRTGLTDALGRTTQFAYDERGVMTQVSYADGTSMHNTFDALGRWVTSTDQAGQTTQYEYDSLGRMTAVVDALNLRTEFGYDEAGNQIWQRDANGHVTSFEYDGLGQQIATVLPIGQRSITAYDAVGNVESATDFNGDTLNFQYDTNNWMLRKQFPDGTSTQFTYTPTGQRATVTDARGVSTYGYDQRDRLLSRTEPDGARISYTYDAAGNRTSVTTSIPGNVPRAVTYTFDVLNRLESVTDSQSATTQYTYDAVENLVLAELPNGITEMREYDSLNRLTYLEHRNSATDDVVSSFQYSLDSTGRRTAVEEHDGRHVEYKYDALNRILGESIFEAGLDPDADPPSRNIDYSYDPVGNRLTRDDSAEGITTYTYDGNDQLLVETLASDTARYEYDANGNMLRKIQDATDQVLAEYEWDHENRLIAADTDGDGTVDVENEYDADGIRASQTVSGQQTKFVVDTTLPHAQVIEEYTSGGVIKASYVFGHNRISQTRGGAQHFYLADGIGSVRALAAATGLITDLYVYDAFGRMLSSLGATANAFLFTGEQLDANLESYYLRARHFAPELGRFVSTDPFAGSAITPLSLHNYLYAHADPVNQVDPSGLSASSYTLTGVQIATVVGGVIGATAGYNWGSQRWGFWGGVLTGAAGLVIGAILGYFVGATFFAGTEVVITFGYVMPSGPVVQRIAQQFINLIVKGGQHIPRVISEGGKYDQGRTLTGVLPFTPFVNGFETIGAERDGEERLGILGAAFNEFMLEPDPQFSNLGAVLQASLLEAGGEPFRVEGDNTPRPAF